MSLAAFNLPLGLTIASDHSLYVADFSNGRVRKIDSTGTVTTFAGGGSGSAAPASGVSAVTAQFGTIGGLAVGPDGTIFLSRGNSHPEN